MRPAFSSRTKRRGITALATASSDDFNDGLDMSYLFCDLDRINSGSNVIMALEPTINFDETVVSGTVLFLTPLLLSTPLSPPLENNPELGRAQRLKKFGSTVGEIRTPRSSTPEL